MRVRGDTGGFPAVPDRDMKRGSRAKKVMWRWRRSGSGARRWALSSPSRPRRQRSGCLRARKSASAHRARIHITVSGGHPSPVCSRMFFLAPGSNAFANIYLLSKCSCETISSSIIFFEMRNEVPRLKDASVRVLNCYHPMDPIASP